MLSRRLFATCALCAAGGLVATKVDAQAPTAGAKRTILQQTDGPADGYVTVLAQIEIAPGAMVMWHTHPGIESAFVLEGGGVLSIKGQADQQAVAGKGFQIPIATPHALQNGDGVTRIAATYVVEKGKPLASPAPQ
jgi:quercetin dioxygenase-like cupin family protein